MRGDRWSFLVVLGAMALWAVLACGKKGLPFLPKQSIPFKVEHLKGEWKDGVVVLRGDILSPQDQGKEPASIPCKVYYAQYAVEAPPCEGCPIAYTDEREMRAEIITQERFYCRVPGITEQGIYFFKVSLMDGTGAMGPPSNRAKVMVEE